MGKIESPDSVVETYFLDIKVGNDYAVISSKKEKLYGHPDKNLPSETLLSLDNNKVEISDLKGRPTLINF